MTVCVCVCGSSGDTRREERVGLEKRGGGRVHGSISALSVRLSLSFTGWMEINRIWPVFLAFHGRSTE